MTKESQVQQSKISNTLNCNLCSNLLIDPKECNQAGCGATLCSHCWNANKHARGKAQESETSQLKTESEQAIKCARCGRMSIYQPCRWVVNKLDMLKWYCTNRDLGCAVETVYSNMADHLKHCQPIPQEELLNLQRDQIKTIASMRKEHELDIEGLRKEVKELQVENEQLLFEIIALREALKSNETIQDKGQDQINKNKVSKQNGPTKTEFKITENEIIHKNEVFSVSFGANGKLLASGSMDKTARISDLTTGHVLRVINHEDWVLSVSLSNDGKFLASGSMDKSARVTDLETGQILLKFYHDDMILSVSLSSDGKLLATGSADSTARVIDLETGQILRTVRHNRSVTSVSLSGNGRQIATGSADSTARVIDLKTGQILRTVKHDDWVLSVSLSNDGKMLATGSRDKSARVTDLETGQNLRKIKNSGYVRSVLLVDYGKLLATGSSNSKVCINLIFKKSIRLMNTS